MNCCTLRFNFNKQGKHGQEKEENNAQLKRSSKWRKKRNLKKCTYIHTRTRTPTFCHSVELNWNEMKVLTSLVFHACVRALVWIHMIFYFLRLSMWSACAFFHCHLVVLALIIFMAFAFFAHIIIMAFGPFKYLHPHIHTSTHTCAYAWIYMLVTGAAYISMETATKRQ